MSDNQLDPSSIIETLESFPKRVKKLTLPCPIDDPELTEFNTKNGITYYDASKTHYQLYKWIWKK
jgi:hypothetical protein